MSKVIRAFAAVFTVALVVITAGCGGESKSGYINSDVKAGNVTLSADLKAKHQVVKEFGASGAWWSTGIGDRETIDKIIEYLYTDKGIALNLYRHNIGGSKDGGPTADDKSGPDKWRAVPCPLKADGSIDISADANGWNVLKKIKSLGTVDNFTIFMNSPPEAMTKNGKTYCTDKGTNLRDDCFDDYAKFIADVTEAYTKAGIPIKYVSPINEPQSSWDAGWQEGCYYSTDDIMKLAKLTIAELNAKKLNTKIELDESAMYANKDYTHVMYQTLVNDDEIYPNIDHFAAHAYFGKQKVRTALLSWTKKVASQNGKAALPIYQTEFAAWAEDNESLTPEKRITMIGRAIHEDLTYLDTPSWCYFAAVARGSDSLIMVNDSDESKFWLTKHFWAIGNYSKFIKGYTRVETNGENLPETLLGSAYLSPKGDKLVYVVVNEESKRQIVTLTGLEKGTVGEVYVTSMNSTCEKSKGSIDASKGFELEAESITTFVFQLK